MNFAETPEEIELKHILQIRRRDTEIELLTNKVYNLDIEIEKHQTKIRQLNKENVKLNQTNRRLSDLIHTISFVLTSCIVGFILLH